MPDKKTNKPSITPAVIFHRTALPFAIFAVVLTSVLAVSKAAILPSLLSVEIAGETRNVQDLKTYHTALQERISVKQEQRNQLVLPMEGTDYQSLADWKQGQYSLNFLLSSISQLAKGIPAKEGKAAVFINSIEYFPIDKVVEVSGDVRNVGPRSMTVLAQFVESLQSESFVKNIRHPTFTRIEKPNLGFVSPFNLAISLQ